MSKTILAAAAALAILATPVLAVDTVTSKDAPDLTAVRAKIKAKDFASARDDLLKISNTNLHADVYSLLGFTLRKTGDTSTSLTYYTKALELQPDHKGAREYLGELFAETGKLDKAKEQLAILARLCPGGCEEREDLQKAIAAKASN